VGSEHTEGCRRPFRNRYRSLTPTGASEKPSGEDRKVEPAVPAGCSGIVVAGRTGSNSRPGRQAPPQKSPLHAFSEAPYSFSFPPIAESWTDSIRKQGTLATHDTQWRARSHRDRSATRGSRTSRSKRTRTITSIPRVRYSLLATSVRHQFFVTSILRLTSSSIRASSARARARLATRHRISSTNASMLYRRPLLTFRP
jgi:hypothetical protein